MKALGLLGITILSGFCTGAALKYQGKPYWTYPMPGKVPANDSMNVNPSFQVPENPDTFTWKLVAPKNSQNSSGIPVYALDQLSRRTKIGSLPVGTNVKLEKFRALGRLHYYSVTLQGRTAWISGAHIAPASRAATGQ